MIMLYILITWMFLTMFIIKSDGESLKLKITGYLIAILIITVLSYNIIINILV